MMRRTIGWCTPALLAGMLACAAGDGPAGSRFRSIGTGGTGGIYYPLGGALASRMSIADPDRRYTAEVTGGAVENVNRVASGEMDLAFVTGNTAFEAFNDPTGPAGYRELRVVAPLYPNVVHVLVSRNARASSIREFRGLRISVGAPGSGTEQLARQLLEAVGIEYRDIDQRFLSFSESAAALRDGAIDAAILSVGYPAAAVLEATTTGGVRLLPVEPDIVAGLAASHPYYSPATIPAGSYPGQDREVGTVAVMNWVVARADLDPATVERVLDILRDDREALVQVHRIARQIELGALRSAPIPLHTAAERWRDADPAHRAP